MFSRNLKESNIEFHMQIKFWTVIFIMLSTVKFAFMVVSVNKANCEVLSIGFGQCTYETPKLCQKMLCLDIHTARNILVLIAGPLFRGCNLVLMGGWYLRMAEAVEACMSSCTWPERPHRPYWQWQWFGRIRPELCGLVRPKVQLKARPNIQPQDRGFESRLCHTQPTSGKNGVGTCPGYMPQWLGDTYCERGMPRE